MSNSQYLWMIFHFLSWKEARWKPFIVRPIPSQLMKPVLVFVNPKSGGNQVRRNPQLPPGSQLSSIVCHNINLFKYSRCGWHGQGCKIFCIFSREPRSSSLSCGTSIPDKYLTSAKEGPKRGMHWVIILHCIQQLAGACLGNLLLLFLSS